MALVKLNNNGVKNATAFGSITGLGNLVLLSTQTASGSSSIDFTSGIDSTYKEYIFIFNNIHPSVNDALFQFNLTIDGTTTFTNSTYIPLSSSKLQPSVWHKSGAETFNINYYEAYNT